VSRRPLGPRWSPEPEDPAAFTRSHDLLYTRFAALYGWAVPRLPFWKTWLHSVLPHLRGPRVLEVAIGPGSLLRHYADHFEAVGVDLNRRMLETARSALATRGIYAPLVRADAVRLPFHDQRFDCVVITMALSGLPRAAAAVAEFRRVLRPDGRLVLLDVAYPRERNALGVALTEIWKMAGDVVRDVGSLLDAAGFRFEEREVGGFGSVHLYVATPASDGTRPLPADADCQRQCREEPANPRSMRHAPPS
jgi:SAM-dependent methyltransferase